MSFKDILEKILPTIEYRMPCYVKCDVSALDFHNINYNKDRILKNNLVEIKITKATNKNNYYDKKSNKFGAILENGEEDGEIHLGADFSYGRENPVSCMHPPVYSPVDGVVEEVSKNKITIKQNSIKKTINGENAEVVYYHSLEHLHYIEENIEAGAKVEAGKTKLGLMGGAGKKETYKYFQHVHYDIKMKDEFFTGKTDTNTAYDKTILKGIKSDRWRLIDPEKFWDKGVEDGICDFEE